MKTSALISIWTLLGGFVLAWKHVSEDALRSALKQSEYTLVAFVHPESDASKALEPEWQHLPEDLNIVTFDCGAGPQLCRELDVASYPAIRCYLRGGDMVRYRGDFKAGQIHAFLTRVRRPVTLAVDVRDVPSVVDSDHIIFIAHVRTDDDETLGERFNVLASKYRDLYSFVRTGPLQGQSILHCVNNIDQQEHTLATFATVQAFEDFVKLCSAPLIPELTRNNEAEYMQKGKSLLHYFFSSEAEKEKYRTEMRPLAKKYAEFLYFTLTDVNEYPEMLKVLGLKEGSKTGLSLQNPNTGDVFPFRKKGRITAEVVEQFLDDVIDGKVQSISTKRKGRHDEL